MRPSLLLLPLVVLAGGLWAAAALWIDGPLGPVPGSWAAGAFAATTLAAFAGLRPLRRGLAAFALLFTAVLVWWLSLSPSNERDWMPDVARLPRATFDGDLVTLHDVRDFHYRSETDFTERWEERTYDLSTIRGVDMFLSYWGSPWIAHTIASWEFEDGRHLAISIETRKERGETYSAVLGFFRQYELYYVIADERDVVGLRADHRGEDVYLYRLTTRPETARAVLEDYLRAVNALVERPRWYNALTQNCTTNIRYHAQHVAPGNPWDWRILVNGKLDALGYERGTVSTDLAFEELRRRSYVTPVARAADGAADFSAAIRRGLPERGVRREGAATAR